MRFTRRERVKLKSYFQRGETFDFDWRTLFSLAKNYRINILLATRFSAPMKKIIFSLCSQHGLRVSG